MLQVPKFSALTSLVFAAEPPVPASVKNSLPLGASTERPDTPLTLTPDPGVPETRAVKLPHVPVRVERVQPREVLVGVEERLEEEVGVRLEEGVEEEEDPGEGEGVGEGEGHLIVTTRCAPESTT